MNKIKLNTGLASIMLVASIFAGWETLLLVTLLMFVFCDVEDKVKDVAVKVITFYVGYTIVTVGWDILMSGVSVVMNGINSLVGFINSYIDYTDRIDATKLVGIIDTVKVIADGVVSIMFKLARLGFIISILTGKPAKKNSMSGKIDEYVNKALNYVSGNVAVNMNVQPQGPNNQPVNMGMPSQANPVPQAPVSGPVNPMNPMNPVASSMPSMSGQTTTTPNASSNNGNN